MSPENIEIVRTMSDQTARRDFSGWFADVTDVVIVAGPEMPDAGLRE